MTHPSGRLITLLSLLQSRRDWSGDELSGRLEVSPRTVRRDIDLLRELGYPVQTTRGPAGGYRLAPGADLPPMLFDDEQAVAIAVALQTATTGVAGVQDASLRALATIRQVLPSRLRHRVDALQVTAVPTGRVAADQSVLDPEVLLQVGACCRDHQLLRFDYVARDGAVSLRRTQPHRLLSRGGRWYAVAWDLDREDWRTFRVDRLTPRVPVGPRFSPRELSEQQVASLLQPTPATAWPARGTVLMHAPAAEIARWVRADQGQVTALGEQTCQVEIGAWSYGAIIAYLLLFEVDLEVLGPPELLEAAHQVAGRLR